MFRISLVAAFVLGITSHSNAALVQRLDAADLPTGALATWSDTSLNSNDVSQATAANQPTVVNGGSAFNSRNVVRFQGGGSSSDVLQSTTVSYNAKEVLILFREDNQGERLGQLWGAYDTAHVAIDGRPGGNNRVFSFDGNQGETAEYSLDGAAFTGPVGNTGPGVWDQDTVHLVNVLYTNTLAFSENYLGSLTPDFNFTAHNLDADIAEILVFDTELTTDERVGLQYLMSRRWGLSGFTPATQSQIDAANALFPGNYLIVPEPSTALLCLGGLAGLALARRRRRC